MRELFNQITILSLRFRWLTILLTVATLILGFISFNEINQELLPDIQFPSTFVVSQNSGASSDQLLTMYSVPLEERTEDVSGVVNIETTSNSGFGFATIRNEFGLIQEQVLDDIQAQLDAIQLPMRYVRPPEGQSASDLVGELSPEAVLWLYYWAAEQNSGFSPQLTQEVWQAFSPEVLGALPEEAFTTLESDLRERLLEKAVASEISFEYDPAAPPALPDSWQGDPRFASTQDLTELTGGRRNLAGVLNNFLDEGELYGPLGTTADLTPEDMQLILAAEESCRSIERPAGETGAEVCSFLDDLDAETLLALPDDVIAVLPENYLDNLSSIEQNEVARARTIAALTDSPIVQQEVLLPDAWRMEKPYIIRFSFSDIPLGAISINSDTMSAEELQVFVDNEVAPRLRDTDLVARVEVQGGEIIPDIVGNRAQAAEGLEVTAPEAAPSTEEAETPEAESTPAPDSSEAEAGDPATTEGDTDAPALPPSWAALAGIADVEEMDSADDLFSLVGQEISGFPITSVTELINGLAAQPTGAFLLDTLTLEVLDYVAGREEGLYESLSPDLLAYLAENNPDLYAELPEAATADAAPVESAAPSIDLGTPWQQLSDNPAMAALPLRTVDDLAALGVADTLLNIAAAAQHEAYLVQLIDSITPQAFEALLEAEPTFLESLADENATLLSYFAPEVLATEPFQSFIRTLDDENLAATLTDIAAGEAPSASQQLQALSDEEEAFVDPNAPAMPPSWFGVAGFIGAAEMDSADDLFNAAAYNTVAQAINDFAVSPQGLDLVRDLQTEHWLYFAAQEPDFWRDISGSALRLIGEDVDISQFPDRIQERIAAGGDSYIPSLMVTRTNLNPSLLVNIFKEGNANTVVAWENVEEVLHEFDSREDIEIDIAFEQASFITESLSGVVREGTLGAALAIVMILIFMNLSFRSTLVSSISIPVSVMMAFLLIRIVPGNVYDLLAPVVDDVGRDTTLGSILVVVLRLFPESFTINIMTLSGLTVAIGRVVDDSIVVLENIYRNIEQNVLSKREAVLQGTREMSVAIFAATATTMVVFLPLGLFGGITGSFFLPFGLANAYALAGSFIVAITIVPVLADLLITRESIPQDEGIPITPQMPVLSRLWASFANLFIYAVQWLSRQYSVLIRWALANLFNQALIIVGALLLLGWGMYLLAQRPQQFLPDFGEPTVTVTVNLPSEFNGEPVTIAQTDAKVRRLEAIAQEMDGVETVQATIGSAGFEGGFVSTGNITETAAAIILTMESAEQRDALLEELRLAAEAIFNDLDNDGTLDVDTTVGQTYVTVSGASIASSGFGGFTLVLSGTDPENSPSLADLAVYNETILATLNEFEGLVNVELLSEFGSGDNTTYIRIDGEPALSYSGEIEADDVLGLTNEAAIVVQDAVNALREQNPDYVPVEISQGFDSEEQERGFQDIARSMGIAIIIAYLLLVLTFRNLLLPIEILISLPLAIVGAAVALTLTDRVLGLPAMIGLLMLVGIVLTNAIVFLDRVQQNRKERRMPRRDALVEAGLTRLRPILMTAATTITAQLPLAASTESGAIIAAELGTVVVGGLISSTVLTLLVLPVIYSVFDKGVSALAGLVGLGGKPQPSPTAGD